MQLHELTQLSAQARMQAMELLWKAMAEDLQHNSGLIPSWHQQVLDKRLARMQASDEKISAWEDAKIRLHDLTQASR